MRLKAGMRLRSQACTTEIVVIRAPSDEVDLRCGGHPMTGLETEPDEQTQPAAGFDTGSPLGKRFVASGDDTVEVLVTKAGIGTLSINHESLTQQGAKPLPASD